MRYIILVCILSYMEFKSESIKFDTLNIKKIKNGEIFFSSGNSNEWFMFSNRIPLEKLGSLLADEINKHTTLDKIVFHDFGGVCEHVLCKENIYLESPLIVKNGDNFLYSFVPTNKKFSECPKMAEIAKKAGFKGTIILTKKEGDRGKASILNSIVKSGKISNCRYYEDTAEVLDTLVKLNNAMIETFWVQPPSDSEFHNMKPANTSTKTISIDEYCLNFN